MQSARSTFRGHAIRAARRVLGALPFNTAMLIARELLAAQGFGTGADVAVSGEASVFRLVKSRTPMLFDCGGHVGDYTGLWLTSFPAGRAFVFEPSAAHLALLEARFSSNPAVRIFPAGLGAQNAQLPLFKNSNVSGLASLSQRRLDHHGIVMDQTENVTIRRLDDVVRENAVDVIDLMKIDVEGHELSVLQGGIRALEQGKVRLVQFEFGGCNLDTHTNLQDFFYFFKDLSFSVAVVRPSMRIVVLDRYEEFFEQYRTTNFLAAPRHVLAPAT
jgi:FkbM family methyltransferase